jgi:hypothetical protein
MNKVGLCLLYIMYTYPYANAKANCFYKFLRFVINLEPTMKFRAYLMHEPDAYLIIQIQ